MRIEMVMRSVLQLFCRGERDNVGEGAIYAERDDYNVWINQLGS